MSDHETLEPITERIVIRNTSNGGDLLHNCFFLPTEVKGFYNFYGQRGQTLATGVSSNHSFPFLLDGIVWEIHKFKIDDFAAHGEWRNNLPIPSEGEDGTFQAHSGGGLAVEDDVEEPVSLGTAPSNAITIKTVTGGSDKDKLKNCYFVPDGTEFIFYSKNDNELASGLTSGNDFSFTHDSIDWTVTNFLIDDSNASGNWSNGDNITNAQDGTFQAQSGGGVDTEASASAATA